MKLINAICRSHAMEVAQEIVQSAGIKMYETDKYSMKVSNGEILLEMIDSDIIVIRW